VGMCAVVWCVEDAWGVGGGRVAAKKVCSYSVVLALCVYAGGKGARLARKCSVAVRMQACRARGGRWEVYARSKGVCR